LSCLLDSSILVAAIAGTHPRHFAVVDAVASQTPIMVYDHSFLEAYRVLTAPSLVHGGFNKPSMETVATLRSMCRAYRIISLTAVERLDALATFANQGVIAARIYDAMIGHAGILHGVQRIMTLNARNFRSLFPHMKIIEPA
jgi:predicted nucleic acid-binding protein